MGGENKVELKRGRPRKDRTKEHWTPSAEALLFLEAYVSGPATGNVRLASQSSGFKEVEAYRLLRKINLASFAVTMKALGINKPYLAHKLRQAMETGTPREVLAGVKLSLEAFGEVEQKTGKGVMPQTFNAPVMIIHGATSERMARLFKPEKMIDVNTTKAFSAAQGDSALSTED